MQYLKTELALLKSQMSNVGSLQQKVDTLTVEIKELRTRAETSVGTGAVVHQMSTQPSNSAGSSQTAGPPENNGTTLM